MSRGRHRMGRRRRDLRQVIAAQLEEIAQQLEEIALLHSELSKISEERDRLLRNTPPGSEEETVHVPRPVLLDETTEIPVIRPDGRSLMATVSPRRSRPSWALAD